MKPYRKLALAALAATTAMAFGAAVSNAATITPSETEVYAIFHPLTFGGGPLVVECNLTLLMHLLSSVTVASLPVPAGTKLGLVTHVEVEGCTEPVVILGTEGSGTSVPVLWLINLAEEATVEERLRLELNPTAFLILAFGFVSCLAEGPGFGITNRGPILRSLRADESEPIPIGTGGFCPSEGNFSGEATLEPEVTLALS